MTSAAPVKHRYSTRLLLSAAAIGAAGGLLVVGLNYALIAVPPSTLSYSIYSATIGAWAIGPLIAMALFRLPGIAFLSTLFAAVINFLAPAGFGQFTTMLIAGVLIELPFAVTLYRRWSDRFFWIAYPVSLALMSLAYFASCLAAGAIESAVFFPWIAIGTLVLTVAVVVGFTWIPLRVAAQLRAAGLGARSTDRVVVPAEDPAAAE